MKDLLDLDIITRRTSPECESLNNYPLAYAYVPYQSFEKPYSMEQSLARGTAFPKLDKPIEVYGKEFSQKAGAKI